MTTIGHKVASSCGPMLARDDTKVKLCLLLPGLAAVGFGIAARLLAGELESVDTQTLMCSITPGL